MPSYDARLRLPGQTRIPLNVVVDVSDERIKFIRGENTLGDWALGDVSVTSRPDGFHFKIDGEDLVLSVSDPDGFAGQLRKQTPQKQDVAGAPDSTTLSKRRDGIDPDEMFADVRERIDRLAADLLSEEVSPEQVFARWVKLLKEINVRHGQGAMPSSLFYRLNTQLLEMMPLPKS